MATHSRLSILVRGLLISTLLLSLSFSSCNATSRRMETMGAASGIAPSCRRGGGGCPTSTMGRDHEGVMHMGSMGPMNSAVAEAKISNPNLMPDHGDPQWGRDSVPNSERWRGSDMVGEDGIVNDTNWGRDAPDDMSKMERTRDFESDSSANMHSVREGYPNRMRNSGRVSTKDMEAKRLDSNAHTMSDSDRMMGRMGNLDGMSESEGMMDSDRMRDHSHRMIDSTRMMHSHHMTNSDRMRDPQGITDSERMMDRMRDSHRMINTHNMTDSDGMMDSERMRDSHQTIDADRMRDSHEMMDSDRIRDSHQMTSSGNAMRDSEINHMVRDSGWRSADREVANDSETQITENAREAQNMMNGSGAEQRRAHFEGEMERDQMKNWNNGRDSNMMENSDRMQQGSERMRGNAHDGMRYSDAAAHSRMGSMAMQQSFNAEPSSCNGASCRTTNDQMMGDAEQMRDWSGRKGDMETRDSEMFMRNMQKGSEQMNTNSDIHRMRNSDAADINSRMGHMGATHDQSSTKQPSSCHGTSCHSTSNQMPDAEQMAMADFHGRGDLETRRGSGVMRNSDNMPEISKQMNTNSHSPLRNSDAADPSRMGHMQKQQSSTMKPSSCQESNCGSTSDAEQTQLSSRRLNAEVIGSQSNNESEGMAGRCSGMNAADCASAQIDEELAGSQSMDRMTGRDGSSQNSCSFNGADCHVAPDGELQGSQTMDDHVSDIKGRPTSCRFNGADCHVTPDRETIDPRSTRSAEMTSCSDEHCSQRMANSEETMTGMANSERMHRTRNDQEIVKSLEWMTSPMANHEDDSQQMRSTDSETMQVHRDRHLGSMHETEKRSSGIWGSKMAQDSTSNHPSSCSNEANCQRSSEIIHASSKWAHDLGTEMAQNSNSNHWSANAEINHRSSCSNEANCQRSMHISSRDSKLMAHRDETTSETEMNHNGSKKSLENRNPTTMDQMNSSPEMRSDSQTMLNAEEINGDSLPLIHRHN